jgi:hypothetical protein
MLEQVWIGIAQQQGVDYKPIHIILHTNKAAGTFTPNLQCDYQL